MHLHNYTRLPGPDFLERVADAELAHGNDVNSDIYRQRGREWAQLQADYDQAQRQIAAQSQAIARCHSRIAELEVELTAEKARLAA